MNSTTNGGSNVKHNNQISKAPTIEHFTFIKPISRGAFGKVFLGHKKGQPEQVYAIKVMKKSEMINKNLTSQVVTERDAMAKVSSPFVVKLFYSIQSQQNIFLVMEYMIGGDVKSLLGVAGYFEQSMAVTYVAEVTLALEYLHCKRIIHRDLKPDNMLISHRGHIKLTDFGLSKFNMCFTDVPMTPKTPMPYFRNYEMYRTPGQILSLCSHLGFSNECGEVRSPLPLSPLAEVSMNVQDRAATFHFSHNITPASSRAQSKLRAATPHLPPSGLVRQKSMRDVLLSQSTSKYVNAMHVSTPGRDCGPVSSLTSTLEASLNWTNSMSDDYLGSSVNIDELSSISHVCRAMSLSLCGADSLDGGNKQQNGRASLSLEQLHDSADNVFETDNGSRSEVAGNVLQRCNCECRQGRCSECLSHSKVPSRQEKLTDDTPQMHRTDESVWSSYAARNLRSLRHGSYSEDSDAELSESNLYFLKENRLPGRASHQKPVSKGLSASELNFSRECKRTTKHKPRRLIKAKSFSHPSDEEIEPASNRYNSQLQFAKKRGFCDVDQSPVRRTQSADSGLTQEFSLLRCVGGEPLYKRSSSLPRTRIRFHSGAEQPAEKMATKFPSSDSKHCLSSLATDCKKLSNIDNMLTLSADEHRLLEGNSDASFSESDRYSSSNSVCRNRPDDNQNACFDNDNKQLCTNGATEVAASGDIMPVNRLLRRTQNKPVVSSLKSDTDVLMTSPNVSSIHEESTCNLAQHLDLDRSVFHADSPVPQNEGTRSPGVQPSCKTAALLPPPPPRIRRLTGKKPPGRLTFASVATCFPPPVYSASSCSSLENSGTGVHASAREIQCPLKVQNQRTPNQNQANSRRSHSVVLANMTPYRTPKSVRRAPLPTEEERILGTPDYLAPEILNQQPHGPAVDWWALGVCMFEFLTGVPPFNDQTPELVFNNILNRDIPWPEGEEAISDECREAIEALLTVDPKERPGARAIRRMRAFEPINWQTLLDIEAPWVPEPDNNQDTTYFQARNMMQDLLVSDVDF